MQYGQLIKTTDLVFEGFHPNDINVGYVKRGIVFTPPAVGQRCAVGGLITSPVTKVEVVNPYHTKVTTENSEYCLLSAMTFPELELLTAVRNAMLPETDAGAVKLEEGFVPFSKVAKIFEAYGLTCSAENLDTNGWQLDFWLEGVNEDGVSILTYTGGLWYANDFELIKS